VRQKEPHQQPSPLNTLNLRTPQPLQERLLRGCPPVVVATPGRLWDLLTHGSTHLSQLDHLSFFVLDEADRMVQQVGVCLGGGVGEYVVVVVVGRSPYRAA